MNPEVIKSKICGTLLGVVVGDMLGEQVEGSVSPGLIESFRKGSRYTDDTEMTLITLQHLMTFKTIKPVSLNIEYATNADYSRKYGGNSAKTLRKIAQQPHQWDSAYKEFLSEGSWGNGCLMRISPIALFDLDDQKSLKGHLTDCLVGTHNSDEALQCSLEYCYLVRELFFSFPDSVKHQQLIDGIIERNLNQRLTDKVLMIKKSIMNDNAPVHKYEHLFQFITKELVEHNIRASDTLAVVIALLIYNCKYKQWPPNKLLSIIISFGGDTDTNAAILGSLLGALYGVDWVAVDWFANIENRVVLLQKFTQFSEIMMDKFAKEIEI